MQQLELLSGKTICLSVALPENVLVAPPELYTHHFSQTNDYISHHHTPHCELITIDIIQVLRAFRRDGLEN